MSTPIAPEPPQRRLEEEKDLPARGREIIAVRKARSEDANTAADDAAFQKLLSKKLGERERYQPTRLRNAPKYKAWTKVRRAAAMPGCKIQIRLNSSCLGNTKAVYQAWDALGSDIWTVVRHSEQRMRCVHPSGNEIWVGKECGNTSKYLWDPARDCQD